MIVANLIDMDVTTLQRFRKSLGKGNNNLIVRYQGREVPIAGVRVSAVPPEYPLEQDSVIR